jgi:Tfp pilus assembly protein PilE
MENAMDLVWSYGLSLLWMLVVLGAAAILAKGIAACGRSSAKERQHRAEEQAKLQRQSQERQQQYWRERHRHAHPQCEVCKQEQETRSNNPTPARRIVEHDPWS